MKTEAISLMIHRKDGQLFVTPWALSKIGFQCIDDLFVAKPEANALEEALQQAAARARDATSVPRDKRFSERGTPYWKRAGARSEKDFVKGTTAVTVVISDKGIDFERFVPMKDNNGMEVKGPPKTLPPGLSLAQIAREVLALFDSGK